MKSDTNPVKPPVLGDIVEVYCSKCRLNLDANVAVVLNGEILKVHCRTCGNFVAYKPPQDMQKKKDDALKKLLRLQEKKHKAATKSAPVVKPSSSDKQRWMDLTDTMDSRSARPYDKHRVFKPGDFVLHKGKGIGYVESVDADARTMIVLFKEGIEPLPYNEPKDND